MKGDGKVAVFTMRHGPWVWALSAILGLLVGANLTRLIPPRMDANGVPMISLVLVIPFGALLTSIALMPLLAGRTWHRHFPDFSLSLGGLVAGYYLVAFGGHAPGLSYGQEKVLHAILEFYSFIALVGGLYVVSGTILIHLKGRPTPLMNTALLAFGALLANVVGTTGASVLLIRPFMRLNAGRIRPFHVVMFIFIVSNCGGCLLPIGDPPLYLGFLKGVPFLWTAHHLWPDWLTTVGPLLLIYFVIDRKLDGGKASAELPATPPATPEKVQLSVRGTPGLICLALMVAGVFVDPALERLAGISGIPVGATFQILVACSAYAMARKAILKVNEFSFFPAKEVSLLFIGIFVTMIPALGYLGAHGSQLGLSTATTYYFGTGVLSAFLDNAPTYLNFLQVALAPDDLTPAAIQNYISTPDGILHMRGISTGAVFFGAMTYIGNGPNFMVRSIASAAGIKMPSFFAYIGWACLILLPILAVHWALLIR